MGRASTVSLATLAVIAVAASALAATAPNPPRESAAEAAAGPPPSACPLLRPARLRTPARFFPRERAGAWIPVDARDCLYLVAPWSGIPRAIFRAPGARRLRGPVWSPDGRELAVSYGNQGATVAVLTRDGRIGKTYLGRDVAFMPDGRLLIGRGDRLMVVAGSRLRPLASRAQLAAAAGFEVTSLQMHMVAGHGQAGVAALAWGEHRSRLLLITPAGNVKPISTLLSDENMTSFPGPPAWSPDGLVLLVPWQRADPLQQADHLHCLSRWTAARGYRLSFCRNPHFDRVSWHPDGGTAFLNDGRIVARDGTVRARIRSFGRGWSVRWAPTSTPPR